MINLEKKKARNRRGIAKFIRSPKGKFLSFEEMLELGKIMKKIWKRKIKL